MVKPLNIANIQQQSSDQKTRLTKSPTKSYQKSFPHEVNGWRDEEEAGNEAGIVLAHLEADPPAHAAADQNEASVGILFLGNLANKIRLCCYPMRLMIAAVMKYHFH